MKCRRSNHLAQDCKAPSRAKTRIVLDNTNQETVQKKRKFNREQLKIMKLGLEEDWGKE